MQKEKREPIYCHISGKKLVNKEWNLYSVYTGKRCKIPICPTNKCGHYGIHHEYEVMHGIWNRIMVNKKCKKCGHKYSAIGF